MNVFRANTINHINFYKPSSTSEPPTYASTNMKQTAKEKWVEETLSSLDGSQRASAPQGLLEHAMRRAADGRARIVRMSATQVWSAAACALVLVVANLYMCLDYSKSATKSAGMKERFAKEYFTTSDAPQF